MTDLHDAYTQQAISDALERERHRIALQLRETLGAQIKLILAQLRAYEMSAAAGNSTSFTVITSLVQSTMQQLRDIEQTLDPQVLNTQGLEAALENLANQIKRSSGVTLALHLPKHRTRASATTQRALYRTTQVISESAITRRQALTIRLHLTDDESGVSIIMDDDGMTHSSGDWWLPALAGQGGTLDITYSRYGGLTHTIYIAHETPDDLTEREQEVIAYLAGGRTNKEIATALGVSARTVKFHLDNIYSKLNISTRTEAAIYALRRGWFAPDT